MLWLVLGLLVLVLLAVWITWTAMRIDRLDARCEGSWQSLDAQLVRRAVALQATADRVGAPPAREAAARALHADRLSREPSENSVSAAIAGLPEADRDEQLKRACVQVQTARTFYNDGVRAYTALRAQRLPRLLRLGARTAAPTFFDIDDSPGAT